MEIDFKLERRIGALSENPSGYTKELNVVVWDGKYTKYDLRTWNPNGKPGKGITLTKEELNILYSMVTVLLSTILPMKCVKSSSL